MVNKIFQKVKLFWKHLTRAMPLNEFENYDEYWGKRGFVTPVIRRAKIISKRIGPNSAILDIGCGDGTLIDYIHRNNSPRRIVGIDISKKAIEYVRQKGHEAYRIDITSSPFKHFMKENNFDYVILAEVLEHIQDPEKLMKILKRSFNKSIFISIPNSGFIIHRLRLLFGKFPVTMIALHVKEHIRFWTHKDFLYWCNFLKFEVVNYTVSSTIKFLNIDLGKVWPSLFGYQIIYELRIRDL